MGVNVVSGNWLSVINNTIKKMCLYYAKMGWSLEKNVYIEENADIEMHVIYDC